MFLICQTIHALTSTSAFHTLIYLISLQYALRLSPPAFHFV